MHDISVASIEKDCCLCESATSARYAIGPANLPSIACVLKSASIATPPSPLPPSPPPPSPATNCCMCFVASKRMNLTASSLDGLAFGTWCGLIVAVMKGERTSCDLPVQRFWMESGAPVAESASAVGSNSPHA
jgi:hypothetical protein